MCELAYGLNNPLVSVIFSIDHMPRIELLLLLLKQLFLALTSAPHWNQVRVAMLCPSPPCPSLFPLCNAEIELRASHILGKLSNTEIYLASCPRLVFAQTLFLLFLRYISI